MYVSLNGEIIPAGEAVIPAGSAAVFYGAGCFETFRADRSSIFKFDDHIKRLNEGIKYLSSDKADPLSAEEIRRDVNMLLQANRLKSSEARVRIQVSLTEEGGYALRDTPGMVTLITAGSYNPPDKHVTLITAETRVISTRARPSHLKLSNMLHYRQAFREAGLSGADDAVMLTGDNFIAETTIANIFWKRGSTIYTPDRDCDILPGIMRNSVLDLLSKKMDVEVREGKYKADELHNSDCIWLTNSVREILAVTAVDGKSTGKDFSFLSELGKALQIYKMEYLS